MKKNTVLILIALLFILSVVLYFVFKPKADTNTIITNNEPGTTPPIIVNPNTNTNTGGNSTSTQTQTTTVDGFPIVYMKYSVYAKELQALLGVKVDGIIGPITLEAWKKYRSDITVRFKIDDRATLNYFIKEIQTQKSSISSGNQSTNGNGTPINNSSSNELVD